MRAPVTWHRLDEDTFTIGRDVVPVHDELTIGVYSSARSIVDSFRLRHLYGEGQAVAALRRWLAKPGNQPTELLTIARHYPAVQPSRAGGAAGAAVAGRQTRATADGRAYLDLSKAASVAGRPTDEFLQL